MSCESVPAKSAHSMNFLLFVGLLGLVGSADAEIIGTTDGFGDSCYTADNLLLIGTSLHLVASGYPLVTTFPDVSRINIGASKVPNAPLVIEWDGEAGPGRLQVRSLAGTALGPPVTLPESPACVIKKTYNAHVDKAYLVQIGENPEDSSNFYTCIWRQADDSAWEMIKSHIQPKDRIMVSSHRIAAGLAVSAGNTDSERIFVAIGCPPTSDPAKNVPVVVFMMIEPTTTAAGRDASVNFNTLPAQSIHAYESFGTQVRWGKRPPVSTSGDGLLISFPDLITVHVHQVSYTDKNNFVTKHGAYSHVDLNIPQMTHVSTATTNVNLGGLQRDVVAIGDPGYGGGKGAVAFLTRTTGTKQVWNVSGFELNVAGSSGSGRYGACVAFGAENHVFIGQPGTKAVFIRPPEVVIEGDIRPAPAGNSTVLIIVIVVCVLVVILIISGVAAFIIFRRTDPGPERNVTSYDEEYFKGGNADKAGGAA